MARKVLGEDIRISRKSFMSLTEISHKAAFIAERNHQLNKQWHTYCNTLIQAITTTKQALYLEIKSSPDEGLHFSLFNHFTLQIVRDTGFNNHTLHYVLHACDGKSRLALASAQLGCDGLLDKRVSNTDRQAVLEHCLAQISSVYDYLYQATQQDEPLTLETLACALPCLARA
jgi:formate hydrogenlyase regulatory protein HycA